jgi:hypothetical protein
MAKKKEPRFQLTAKGLIQLATNDEEITQDIWDELELHCYHNDFNAILIDPEGGKFVKIELKED